METPGIPQVGRLDCREGRTPCQSRIALGLDLGTTSIAVIAVDEAGNVVDVRGAAHGADVTGLPTGRAEQDVVRIREIAIRLLAEVARELPEPPVCLGVTGQMHGVVLLGADGRLRSNLITWQDRRANEPVDSNDPEGPSFLVRLLERCDAEAIERTGTRPSPGFLGVTLAVLAARREIPSDATRAVCLADAIVADSCGITAVTAPSHAASTGLFDVASNEWSESLVAAAGFDPALLPEVHPDDAVVGHLTREFAEAAGLPVGLPVCNAVGDHQASILGSVPPEENALHVNIGTGGQIDWPIEEFVRIDGMDTRPLPIGRRMLVGAGLAGGDAFAWVQRTASRWGRELCLEVDPDHVYARLLELAGTAFKSALTATPTFRGTRTNPTATGSFTGITNDNFGLGDVANAVLTGIAAGFHDFLTRAGSHAPVSATRIIGTGNALDRNPLLVQRLEERFGLTVTRPAYAEAAAYGAAVLAGTACGRGPTLAVVGTW